MFPGMVVVAFAAGRGAGALLALVFVLGFSSLHSEGVSMMRVTTSLNASVTPTAVLADASTNRHPVRPANAAASDVGTWREYS
jgi:uncharacterized membrane protein (DUF441 family)